MLFTVVYRLKPEDQDQLVAFQNHPKAVAFSVGDYLKDRNFCQRCGKRLGTDPHIHTCTPPADTRTDWSAA